jgi:alkanesulfonate monooxygenase SsuD/methylene tetrahydromethanopterin reductase-like flavin-dependent oxidoreductase (luciferase family)
MKVFVFDLMPYARHFDEFKADRLIPYPLPGRHFDPEVAARTYADSIALWKEMDRLGFDGVGLNEHHTTVHGMMNAPNMMAAVGAQHTERLKFLQLGNLIPLHNPLRIAEEIAMADCMSRGRLLAGFARGNQREYGVFQVKMSESRARFEEAFEIILKAWTEEVFSYEGKFWSFKDIAIWPRPYQQPHPPIWIPFTGSKETIDWAAKYDLGAVLPTFSRGVTRDMVGYFAKSLAAHGRAIRPDQIGLLTDAWVADSQDAALAENGPYFLYFNQTLWHHGSLAGIREPNRGGYVTATSYDYIKPENRASAGMDREKIRRTEMTDIEARVRSGHLAWGSPKEVADHLIELGEYTGANVLVVNLNLGAVPGELMLEQVRRFGRDVLPRLHAHQVTRVPAAAMA